MTTFNIYTEENNATVSELEKIRDFLHLHLEQYGDSKTDIEKSLHYAMGKNGKPGGHVIVAVHENEMAGAVVVNKTGMEGFIPENILVYIATDRSKRGTGIGKALMLEAIQRSQGDIALHCEPDNPAKNLYTKLGFTSKYLEMRLKK